MMPCPADFDYNGVVDVDDLVTVLNWWSLWPPW
jgi:hypothetical protein